MTSPIFKPTSPMLPRALGYGAILTIVIAVLGSVVGYLIAGFPGLWSALIGAGVTALFMGFTAVTIIIANRVTGGEASSTVFFAIILGAWLLKFVVFIAIIVALRGAPFIDPVIMFFAILVAVIGSLTVDVLAYTRSRVPYVGDIALPGDPEKGAEGAPGFGAAPKS